MKYKISISIYNIRRKKFLENSFLEEKKKENLPVNELNLNGKQSWNAMGSQSPKHFFGENFKAKNFIFS